MYNSNPSALDPTNRFLKSEFYTGSSLFHRLICVIHGVFIENVRKFHKCTVNHGAFSQKTENYLVWDSLVSSLWHMVTLCMESLKMCHICLICFHFFMIMENNDDNDGTLCMESLEMFHVSFCQILNEYENNDGKQSNLPLWDRLSSWLLEVFPPGRRNRT